MLEDLTLDGYLEASAARWPDRVAILDCYERQWTYRQLNERSNQVARAMVENGVKPGDRVGLCLPKSAEGVAAIFGILKARAAYVPVDYTAPAERNRYIFSNCKVAAAIVQDKCAGIFAPAAAQAGGDAHVPPVVFLYGTAEAPAGLPPGLRWLGQSAVDRQGRTFTIPAKRDRNALAYILYTSGSTGLPKGVMLSHENGTSYVDWCTETFAPNENDRFSSHAPFHFDLSILDIYVPLKHGARLYVISEEVGKEPMKLGQYIADSKLTSWYSVPSILTLLTQYGNLDKLDCSSLRYVHFAGEVFPVKHLRRIKELWRGPQYFNLYGPTETNVCTYYRIPDVVPPGREEPFPIGKVCSHCESLVVDDNLQPVAKGEEGLLYIAGKPILQGYWGLPEREKQVFLQRDGKRFYNTGDVVREEENGDFVFLGRKDRMVKRRGYRIELGEIEAGLYKHPEIKEAAALAIANDEGVTIEVVLCARGEKKPGIIELKSHCAKVLPSYMSPDRFVFLDKLPRTSTDKVDYQSLLRMRTQGK